MMRHQSRTMAVLCFLLVLAGLLFCATPTVRADESEPDQVSINDLAGSWLGTLDAGVAKLRIGVTIQSSLDGRLQGTLISIDQGGVAIPIDEILWSEGELRFEIKKARAGYRGTFDKKKAELEGQWKQAALELPLKFAKVDKLPTLNRPQEPKKPFPYRDEEVTFRNEQHEVTLAGTFTLPKGAGPFPAAILISGSGPQDRDEQLLGHRPFLVLADDLTRRGIAVLRFDDRGVGKSTGNHALATSEDFAEDVRAGVRYLKSRPEVDAGQIGLIGHSEGGLIAPMVAESSTDVAFIVMLAGPGVSGEAILQKQLELLLQGSGETEEEIGRNRRLQERLLEVVKNEPDDILAAKKLEEIFAHWLAEEEEGPEKELAKQGFEIQAKRLLSPWFRFFVPYDPRPALSKVSCPVLAVIGEKDIQVQPEQNLPVIREAFGKGGNQDFTVEELPGLNHLLQPCKTGMPAEYSQIETTISPDALQIIGEWIQQRTEKS